MRLSTDLPLAKLHGLGNDFLVGLGDAVPDGAAVLARRLCHRTHGVGADGLVFGTELVVPADGGDDPVRATFTLFNSDGSPAEISGNGMRCFAHAIARTLGRQRLDLMVTTIAGVRDVAVSLEGDALVASATVAMGPFSPLSHDVDVDEVDKLLADLHGVPPVVRWATGQIGNPHIVIEVERPDEVDLVAAGTRLEAYFGGINAHFVAPRPDGDGLDMRVWERGAGLTEACGSGACAVGAVAARWGLADHEIHVHMPGGTAIVTLDEATVRLTGPSEVIADLVVPAGTRSHG